MLAARTADLPGAGNIHEMAVKIDRKADVLITTISDYFTMSVRSGKQDETVFGSDRKCCEAVADILDFFLQLPVQDALPDQNQQSGRLDNDDKRLFHNVQDRFRRSSPEIAEGGYFAAVP